MLLDGKVALVIGAARGLGWGISRALGQAGARVCITDINDSELARAEDDLVADGTEVLSMHLDVAELAAFQDVVRQVVDRWGRLDVMVQNAIYMPVLLFEDTSPGVWWRQLHVSLGGLFNATRACWDVMRVQGGGHIVGIASGSSVRGYKEEVAYCAGKHGQEGFIKSLALEAEPYNIALNTLGPGKRIKPTRITWEELDAMSDAEKEDWADPVELGKGFVWLASQPPNRFSGLRFDAGVIADTVDREGYDFDFHPEKVTLYVDDMIARRTWRANYAD
jgi:3-oxoacyl-[acyl-carrier protein] reductase